MPFVSKAQQKMMFAKHPEIAKRWAKETPSIKALPEHVAKKRRTEAQRRAHADKVWSAS